MVSPRRGANGLVLIPSAPMTTMSSADVISAPSPLVKVTTHPAYTPPMNTPT